MKIPIKKFIAFLMCMSMIFAVAIPIAADSGSVGREAIFTELLSLKIGDGEGEAGYDYGEQQLHLKGPGSLHVKDDGKFSILDSVNQRILLFNSDATYSGMLPLPKNSWPTQMVYCLYNFIVLDYNNSCVYVIPDSTSTETDANKIIRHNLPDGLRGPDVCDLLATPKGVAVTDIDDNYYYLNSNGKFEKGSAYITYTKSLVNESDVKIKRGLLSWNIQKNKSFDSVSFKGTDPNGNAIVTYSDFVDNTSVFMFEKTIRKYDPQGNLIGCALIDYADDYTYPNQEISVTSNGTIYHMACQSNQVVIRSIELGTKYVSKMDELQARCKDIESTTEDNFDEVSDNSISETQRIDRISLSRASVEDRATQMAQVRWVVLLVNVLAPSGASVPPYIKYVGVGNMIPEEYAGIPYCRGGTNGIDTYSGYPTFATVLTNNATGNTRSGDIVDGTVGLDCSGFVTSAYRLPKRYNTSGLRDYIGREVPSLDDLQLMDFAVRTGSNAHVVLFVRKNTAGTYRICDCTTSSTDLSGNTVFINRVTYRDVRESYFKGYDFKSPW